MGFHEVPHIFLEARGAGRPIGFNGDTDEVEAHFASLDDAFQGVAVLAEDGETEGSLTGVGAEATDSIGDIGTADGADDATAEALEPFFEGGEMVDAVDLAVTDNDIGLVIDEGNDEVGDRVGVVLVIGIGVNDDIGAEAEAGIKTGLERLG